MVKCSECGFLSLWWPYERKWEEADLHLRETGGIEIYRTHDNRFVPRCFVLAEEIEEDIKRETNAQRTGGLDYVGAQTNAIKTVITNERQCPKITDGKKLGFTKWEQGFTPKEHREMQDRTQMLKWQDERDERDKQWRAGEERKTREWQETQERRRFNWNIIIFGLCVTAILVIAQIVAAFIERGGQPTIINNIPAPQVIPPQSSTPDTPNVQPPAVSEGYP